MASRWCALALCAVAICAASTARAEPRVVIVETRDAPPLPGLAAQVRLHAGRAVIVHTLQDKTAASMTYAARASALVGQHDATIVVWVASSEGDGGAQRTFLVFAAGRFPDRALLELVRLDASTPPGEVERTVALKIAGLFDALVTPRPIGHTLGVEAIHVPSWRVELAALLVAEAGDRGLDRRPSAGADRRWPATDWVVAVGASAYWQPSSAIAATPGVVSIDEIGARVAVGLERPMSRLTWFVRPQLTLAALWAEGTSYKGPHGSAIVWSQYLGADVGARWHVSDSFELTTAIGGEWALTRQQFLVDGQPAADLRHGRAMLTVGMSIPFH